MIVLQFPSTVFYNRVQVLVGSFMHLSYRASKLACLLPFLCKAPPTYIYIHLGYKLNFHHFNPYIQIATVILIVLQ